MIDDNLDKKIRLLQAKMIQNSPSSVRYSKVINEMLEKGIKK